MGELRMIIHLILRVIFLLGVGFAFWLEFERVEHSAEASNEEKEE
jgi:flagellar basal body-associated protein FliL